MRKYDPSIKQSNLDSDSSKQQSKSISNFTTGFMLSGILVFTIVSSSVCAGHTSIFELGYIRIALAISVPFIIGILSVVTKGAIARAIGNADWSGL